MDIDLSGFVGKDVTIVYQPEGRKNEPRCTVEGHVEAYSEDAVQLSQIRSPIRLPENYWLPKSWIMSISPKDTPRLWTMFFKAPPVTTTPSS